ncbi:Uncharacterized protein dnl_19110 [Desulfonema limicola]|uniref:Uncharacterized protein n=1 Tax=Desulfonema limicola TaxID=45656 RepID=A0A975GFX9_9BACT|nr:Uncharacterized protein dnl_19110 [Desulfonema limicola]
MIFTIIIIILKIIKKTVSQSPQSRVNDFHWKPSDRQLLFAVKSQSPQSRVNDFHLHNFREKEI